MLRRVRLSNTGCFLQNVPRLILSVVSSELYTPTKTHPLTVCLADLREHAIFALRNLLHGNNENQLLVNDIQPMAEWDDNGILQR